MSTWSIGALAEGDAAVQLATTGTDDVLRMRQPKGHEQQAGLVDVAVVLVHHRNLGRIDRKESAQSVGGQRATRSTTENHDLVRHHLKSTLGDQLPRRAEGHEDGANGPESSVPSTNWRGPQDPTQAGVMGCTVRLVERL